MVSLLHIGAHQSTYNLLQKFRLFLESENFRVRHATGHGGFWLTAEEESQLNQEMQVSGGIYEGEWKEFAEEFRQRMLANGESA